jgi:hypothetical protein
MSALLWAAGLLAVEVASARASVTFTGSGTNVATGQLLAATATFDSISGGTQLQLTLSNLGGAVHDKSDILTGVFFDLNGVGTMTPVSALLNSGSVLLNGPLSSGDSLGDNWEYLANLSGVPGNPTRGIAAAGLGIFSKGNFGSRGQNLQGADYGLINGTGASGNDHIPGMQLENNSMVFTLGGLPAGFSLSAVSDVEFQYGTTLAPSEPMLVARVVPEPSALALLALGGVAFFRRPRG